uniref:RHD domain-containing protein n=1 Tax=Ciona savignyi TaxID=51511 RepID=H2YII1_CIOSA
PYLEIIENPKSRGFRFRYTCEGPSHGGIPGGSSDKNKKTFPAVKICNYQGYARIVVQLVTNEENPRLHPHSLVGKQCQNGICTVQCGPKDMTATFPNLGIQHVTKKNVATILEERYIAAEMQLSSINDGFPQEVQRNIKGEILIKEFVAEEDRKRISVKATSEAKSIDLSVVRLMFIAYLPDSNGAFTIMLKPVISDAIFDSKAPNAATLKICRMDCNAGSASGGDEVYLLCDKVQKDDIQVVFSEEDMQGNNIWEGYGNFSPTDVHRQFAIVFRTPQYRDVDIKQPVNVQVQLRRKSDHEVSEAKPFTYLPNKSDLELIDRKRRKPMPDFVDHLGNGNTGGSGSFRGDLMDPMVPQPMSHAPLPLLGQSFFELSEFDFSNIESDAGLELEHDFASAWNDEQDVPHTTTQQVLMNSKVEIVENLQCKSKEQHNYLENPHSKCTHHFTAAPKTDLRALTKKWAERNSTALHDYSITGDVRMLLVLQRHLTSIRDHSGDSVLHVAVIHDQLEVLSSLLDVVATLDNKQSIVDAINKQKQTALQVAVLTDNVEAVIDLIKMGANPLILDSYGNHSIHVACRHGNASILYHLLNSKQLDIMQMDMKNHDGLGCFHLAAKASQGTRQCLGLLKSNNFNVNMADTKSGRTALHLAVEMDNLVVAGCLISECDADMEAATYEGYTPLHVAASLGLCEIATLLLACGADPDASTSPPGSENGITPADLAASDQMRDLLNGIKLPFNPKITQNIFSDIAQLDEILRLKLCKLLNAERTGSDWLALAERLSLGSIVTFIRHSENPTNTLLDNYMVS